MQVAVPKNAHYPGAAACKSTSARRSAPMAFSLKTACATASARRCSASSRPSSGAMSRLKASRYAASAASAARRLSASATPWAEVKKKTIQHGHSLCLSKGAALRLSHA